MNRQILHQNVSHLREQRAGSSCTFSFQRDIFHGCAIRQKHKHTEVSVLTVKSVIDNLEDSCAYHSLLSIAINLPFYPVIQDL
jgi:hypothetical protein